MKPNQTLDKKVQDAPTSSLSQYMMLLGVIAAMIAMALLTYYVLQCLSNRSAAAAGHPQHNRQNKSIPSERRVAPWCDSDTESQQASAVADADVAAAAPPPAVGLVREAARRSDAGQLASGEGWQGQMRKKMRALASGGLRYKVEEKLRKDTPANLITGMDCRTSMNDFGDCLA